MVGVCQLCKKKLELIRSHIIPEGFYKNLYDEKSRAWYASKSRDTKRKIQKGYREYLLCKNCDGNIIGKYDKYAIEVIRDKKHIKEKEYINAFKWDGLDYNLFKLFHLSVLWRAHIANDNTRGVTLNEEQANEIREYILSGTAPDKLDYPILGMYLIDTYNNEVCNEIISFGNCYECIGMTDSKTFVFIFGGIAWHYVSSNNAQLNEIEKENILMRSTSFRLQKQNIRDFKPFQDLLSSVSMISRQ